jgi:ParB/RepB/Spo0J family partition protein
MKNESGNTRERLPRKDIFLVNPMNLLLEEGFNTRVDYGDLDELKNSILENGVKIPLRGFKRGDKYVINDGHRRYKAIMLAIGEGHEIVRVPFISEKPLTAEERLFEILLSNDGKPLTPLELGETYKKLQNFGFKVVEIAKRTGKSSSHILDMISVSGSSKEVKEAIKEGTISATLVKEVQKAVETPEQADEIIKVVTDVQKEAGEKKVTKKDFEGILPPKPKKEKAAKPASGEIESLEDEPLHIKDKIHVKEYNSDLPFTEKEVADLLRRQIGECAKQVPSMFRKKVIETALVI